MSFKARMEETSRRNGSNIVLALDFPFQSPKKRRDLFIKAQKVLDLVHQQICAVKLNHHLVLPLGVFQGAQQLVDSIHKKGLNAIMDCKVNDIGSTNQVIAEYYFAAGFDALIANPFIGWEEGLEPIFEVAQKLDRGIILLTYMSHKGAKEGYGQTIFDPKTGGKRPQYISFAAQALRCNADGAVVGATHPEKIREIHDILREKVPIYSPGIGAQGGTAQEAVKAGARYLIVGREITLAEDPLEKVEEINSMVKHVG